ncbi:MAG: heavy metal sensor histidine kinase [Alphaproteobacteria bacterium]|nr:heavy metal sensor histidine kinase [Alphaproteobacteria bacterium]
MRRSTKHFCTQYAASAICWIPMHAERTTSTFSIGARLALFYCLAILLATAVFAGVAYWRLQTNFAEEHARFLEAKIGELREDFTDGHGNPQDLLSEIAKETAGTRLRQYEARVVLKSRVLGETPGMSAELPMQAFPAMAPPQDAVKRVKTVSIRRHHYVLTSVALMAPPRTPGLDLQIALDITRDTALLESFLRAMILTFLLLAPVLILSGLWISARGLAPVRRIADAAQAVTPLRLSERIPMIPPWPKELAGLVKVFNAMLDRLEEAFGRLSRFSADLAHELRTPLGNLIGEIEVSLRRTRTVEEYQSTLESNLEECHRLNALIEDLLFLARAEHAEIILHRERVAVRLICDQAVARTEVVASGRGVHVCIDGDAELAADPVLLEQALTNLLSNAVRHSPDGATVLIRIREPNGGRAMIAIHNGGAPIAAQHLPHLFDRFYQIDPARKHAAGQGTGLGLSIVQLIMSLHGGTVSIESAEGAGTTATLFFPTHGPAPSKMTEMSSD